MTAIKNALLASAQSAFGKVGLEIRRKKPHKVQPVEFNDEEKRLFSFVRQSGFSMSSDERMFTTMMACRHVVQEGVEGDFVECGVWRGGNAILATGVFKMLATDRSVHLFDTFAGMTAPTELDTLASNGATAESKFLESQRDSHNEWAYCSLQQVQANFKQAGLLNEKVKFIQGDVLKTLQDPRLLPEKIAVLRLDTDWYESTKMELEVLYPRLSVGGVLIVDDYGHWAGSKIATDEYFQKHGSRPFLQYTDSTGRVAVKVK